jgi:N,N'-diacetylchitobiose transport system permease protein
MRQRRPDRRLPLLLVAPSLVVLIAVLGYPLARVVILSFQEWGITQIFSDSPPKFAGLANYRRVLGDDAFWHALWRTLVLTAVMVAGSMLAGVGVALLMERVPAVIRRLMTFVLVLAWAVPSFVSTQIFGWLTEQNFGVANHVLGLGQHNWYVQPIEGLTVATAVVIWGAVPFIAITTYAGLTQVPRDLVEAARLDGASGRQVLTRITLPLIRPILAVVTSLSVIWDFQVFNQIWLLRNSAPEPGYQTLTTYAYLRAYTGHEYGYASAVAVVTILLLVVVMIAYLRQISRAGDVT